MLSLNQTRTIEILQSSGWVPATLPQLVTGDIFRIFEPDGSPVLNAHGNPEFRALSLPRTEVEPLSVQESAMLARASAAQS